MSGFILYQGPSKLDGKPIVVIFLAGSKNTKTGNMAQTYIIRADIDPVTANRIGEDYSICGACPLKGVPNIEKSKGWADNRACYVNLIHGPNQVYKAYKAGKYKQADTLTKLGEGHNIRLGTYGDPLAVPSHIWRALTLKAKGFTGYTHQSETLPESNISRVMISTESKDQAQSLHSKGIRTFRVIPISTYRELGQDSILKTEVLCPASIEAGKKTTCNNCNLCQGQYIKAKSIAIVSHGIGKSHL